MSTRHLGFPPVSSAAFRRRVALSEALGPPRAREAHPFFRRGPPPSPSGPAESAGPPEPAASDKSKDQD